MLQFKIVQNGTFEMTPETGVTGNRPIELEGHVIYELLDTAFRLKICNSLATARKIMLTHYIHPNGC